MQVMRPSLWSRLVATASGMERSSKLGMMAGPVTGSRRFLAPGVSVSGEAIAELEQRIHVGEVECLFA